MAPARCLLLVAGLAALATAEFPDLTLVLQPDEDLDWNQITRWMEQSRFSVDAGSQHHALPPTPTKTPPGAESTASGRHSGHSQPVSGRHSGHPQPVSDLSAAESSPAALVAGGPAVVVPGPALAPGGPAAVVPGPALVPGRPAAVVPGPPLVPGASPIATSPALAPNVPPFRPTWRPGPALLPGASPPSPLAKWKPQWSELRPGPPLVPRPPLVSDDPAVLQPNFRELQRDEPLLPADAPGAYQPEPFTEPPSPPPTEAATEGPAEQRLAGGGLTVPSAASADFQDISGLLPPDERERYQPPEMEDYDQQAPPAQLNMAAGPPPPPPPPPAEQQPERHQSPSEARSRLPVPAGKAGRRTGPGRPADQQPQDSTGYPDQRPQQQTRYTDQRTPQQPAGYQDQRSQQQQPAGYPDQRTQQQPAGYPDQRTEQQPAGYPDQRSQQQPAGYPDQRTQQQAGYRRRASPAAADAYPGLEEYPGPRLLAQEASVAEQQQGGVSASVGEGEVPARGAGVGGGGGGGGQMPPHMLAVLLQRLEERLVASETQQQQQNTHLRTVQHSQRKAEVVAMEDKVAIRSEFRDLNTKMDNLQHDLGRMATMLETVMTDVQGAKRTLREQAALAPSSGAADQQPAQLVRSVAELGKKLGQLVVNTELLKGGQRRLGGNVRTIVNRTSELSERSEQFATQVSLATSLSEMRTYLDHQKRVTVGPVSKEDEALPRDCSDVLLFGEAGRKSGIYQVRPRHAPQPIFVYCDQETDGGGWAVIQRRTNGDEDFFRDWISYKYGFGNLAGEFWLGNENIYLLTNHRLNELRVELADFPRERPGFEDYPGSNATARYGAFALGSETEGYPLKVLDNYSGDAGDSLKYHAGMKFSTKDVDNDLWKEDSCAASHKGGWWYKGCDSSNLNGLYLSGPVPSEFEYQVVYWYDWRGPLYSLYQTQMMVRPADHAQRAAETHRRGSGRGVEDGKTAAQRRLSTQTVRGRSRRRRQRRRRGRRQGH